MPENVFCIGQKKATQTYQDGYMRAFKGYPKMSAAALDLLKKYLKKRQYHKIMLFFVGHFGFDKEYSGFLVREMIRGNL